MGKPPKTEMKKPPKTADGMRRRMVRVGGGTKEQTSDGDGGERTVARRFASRGDGGDGDGVGGGGGAAEVGMSISMEAELGDEEVARSKEGASGERMDLSRDSGRRGENGVKAELCSPGPSTPMQVASLPQQKPREATSVSCPDSATTGSTHSFEAAKASCELQLPSGTPQSLPAPTQGETENGQVPTVSNESLIGGSQTLENSCPLLCAVQDDFGRPSVSVYPHTMGGCKKALLKDKAEIWASSKSSEEEASMPTMDQVGSDRAMDHPTSGVKTESAGFTLDAGLSLGSQFLGSKERCVEFSPVWESVGARGGRGGQEGVVVLQSSQGKGEHGEGEWKGKHLQLSLSPEMDEKAEGVEGNVEHRFRQVLDSSDDLLTKRVKREVVETTMSLDGSREQILERNEDRDRRRSGMYENKQEDFRSLFWGNGGAALLSQSYRENAFGRILEMGGGEPKTMVVKKTPKRVHNSDPSAMFSRSELLMFEDSMRSPGLGPRTILSPSIKQGANGSTLASDLTNYASQNLYSRSADKLCGRDRGVEHRKDTQDGSSVLLSQLESRMDKGSACSLMSTSNLALSMGEPALPFSLNFSPKPQRPAASISRNSTEEEWGKSLALCGPGAERPSAVERSGEEAKALGYQERFVQLQLFLKKCDEDDQSHLLDALRPLSAAGRSSHAVALEQRALWLSIEEGKEMTRLKSLNVMGQRSSMQGPSEAGCTPQGPRVSCFGAGAEYAPQQSLANTRSPQVISGSMGGSAYKESYRPG